MSDDKFFDFSRLVVHPNGLPGEINQAITEIERDGDFSRAVSIISEQPELLKMDSGKLRALIVEKIEGRFLTKRGPKRQKKTQWSAMHAELGINWLVQKEGWAADAATERIAELMGVSAKTVRNWRKSGAGPFRFRILIQRAALSGAIPLSDDEVAAMKPAVLREEY